MNSRAEILAACQHIARSIYERSVRLAAEADVLYRMTDYLRITGDDLATQFGHLLDAYDGLNAAFKEANQIIDSKEGLAN